MAKVNPKFAKELTKYGVGDFNACFNCGNCTATCSLSTNDSSFPREMVRYTTLGLEDEIRSSLKPWECYYCGECSKECPRQANPGELMMSLRRWLTAQYDWTGLSGLLYRSLTLSIAALLLVAAGDLLLWPLRELCCRNITPYGTSFRDAGYRYRLHGNLCTQPAANVVFHCCKKWGESTAEKLFHSPVRAFYPHVHTEKGKRLRREGQLPMAGTPGAGLRLSVTSLHYGFPQLVRHGKPFCRRARIFGKSVDLRHHRPFRFGQNKTEQGTELVFTTFRLALCDLAVADGTDRICSASLYRPAHSRKQYLDVPDPSDCFGTMGADHCPLRQMDPLPVSFVWALFCQN